MLRYMVTTEDNPFNYFVQPEQWQRWDEQNGYCTLNYLMRLVPFSPELDETEEYNRMLEDAVDDIIRFNLTGNYKIVWNPSLDAENSEPERV